MARTLEQVRGYIPGIHPRSERADRIPECAKNLAKDGANLALHYNSAKSKDQTVQFRKELVQEHPEIKVSIHSGDLGTAAAVEQLFKEVLEEHSKLDIVVNTAGMVLKKPITEISEKEYDKMFAYAVYIDEQRRRCVDQFHTELIRRQHFSC